MQNYVINPAVFSVYPGNYVPKHTVDEITEALGKSNDAFLYPIKRKELKDVYLIEIEIPGAKSEDFVLEIDDNILWVCMLHNEEECFDGESFNFKNLKSVCFRKKIILPNDADTMFIAAEYKAGILHLVFPKTKEHTNNIHQTVVVY